MQTTDHPESVPPRATAALRPTSWAQRRSRAQQWTPTHGKVVVVVPHPDDEVLIMGGLLHHILGTGTADVIVVAVTDGEAAYGAHGQAELGRQRRFEQRTALARLSPKQCAHLVRLGFPDSGVRAHETALADVVSELADPGSLIVAPWRHDHHSDHEACGRAAHIAAQNRYCDLAEGLFWAWQHPPKSPSRSLHRLALSTVGIRDRRAALDAHRSQLKPVPPRTPVLAEPDLAPMTWSNEYYFLARSPHR